MWTSRLTNGYRIRRKGADMPASYIRPHHNVAPCQMSAVPKIDTPGKGRLLACRVPLTEQCIYNPAPSYDDFFLLWPCDVTGHYPPSTMAPTLPVNTPRKGLLPLCFLQLFWVFRLKIVYISWQPLLVRPLTPWLLCLTVTLPCNCHLTSVNNRPWTYEIHRSATEHSSATYDINVA
jgi:hypothetical protein